MRGDAIATVTRSAVDRDVHANGIDLSGVGRQFGSGPAAVTAVVNVDLQIRSEEFFVLVGPSGCGKSTLLRMLAGLDSPTSGDVRVPVAKDGPSVAVVFQEQGIFPWLTVLENTAFGLTVRGMPRRERETIARDYLRKLGLTRFESAFPGQLSGGMRQRVNLARAFATDAPVLLMDEPLGALDEQTKMLVQDDLLHIWDQKRKTVFFITHSLDEAIVLGDRVGVMTRRPGRIKAIFDVPLPRPRNVLELRNDPAFLEIRRQIWDSLSAEVVALQDDEELP